MRTTAAVLVALFALTSAAAQDREVAFGAGYGQLFLDGHYAGPLEEQGGVRMNLRFPWPASERRPELRVGAGVGLAFYVSEQEQDEFDDNDFFFVPDKYTQLTVISPNVEAAWRQPVGERFYLEPGPALDLLVGNFIRGDELFGFVDDHFNRWAVGVAGREFLRAAFRREEWSFGVELSYSYGYLDFGHDIGGETQQAYVGLFFAHSF